MPEFYRKPPVEPLTLARAQALRRALTQTERKLWYALNKRQLCGLRFRRQHPFPPYILDFYCHAQLLAIEVDGSHHSEPEQQAHDQRRTAFLTEHGVRVLRFTNHDVETNLEGVLEAILAACEDPPTIPPDGGEARGGPL